VVNVDRDQFGDRFFAGFEESSNSCFADEVLSKKLIKKEIWINTSEAEILPALNPSYEISKSLIGQLVSFKKNLQDKNTKNKLIIKKIILGPFKSELNPLGIMSPKLVSKKIYDLANSKNILVIISPNPLTYVLFPLKEFFNFLYCQIIYKYKS